LILTGFELVEELKNGKLVIDPFDPGRVEPNSYGFALGPLLLEYLDDELDAQVTPRFREVTIPDSGTVLQPDRLYLGETAETMGSDWYAATLYASRSTATMGIWIQCSAPLGHTGAIIPWTLEIRVAQPVKVYPSMLIGKIAFWLPQGDCSGYQGLYADSTRVRPSRLALEFAEHSESP
jgi:dCTP deaminase